MRTNIFPLNVNMKFSLFHEKLTDCVRSHVPLKAGSHDPVFAQIKKVY